MPTHRSWRSCRVAVGAYHPARVLALLAVAWLCAVAARASAGPALASQSGCLGRWEGAGQNSGSPQRWGIHLNLERMPSEGGAGGRCGTIEYTNPACGGTLEDCVLSNGEIRARENYTHSDGACAPPGEVLLRCEQKGARMRFAWLGWERVDSVLSRPR